MDELFYALFADKKRRRQIMSWWHVSKPVNGKNIKQVFKNFIKTILYDELIIEMTPNEIKLFKNKHSLIITYRMMTKIERDIVYDIFKKRHKLFTDVSVYQTGNGWKLSGYKKKTAGLFDKFRRNELIRDFVYFVLTKKKMIRDVKSILIDIVQLLIENEKKRGDKFLANLYNLLQGIGDINNLLALQ